MNKIDEKLIKKIRSGEEPLVKGSIYDRWAADAEIYRQLEIKKYGRELTEEEKNENIEKRWKELVKEREEYDKLHGANETET